MHKEATPGRYLCRIGNGNAYYLVTKGVYDMVEGWTLTPEKRNRAYWEKLDLDHLLGKTRYPTEFNKIKLVNWSDLPLNYQLDAIALNEEIRKVYGKDFSHVQLSIMSEQALRSKIFRVVDDTTQLLRDFRWKGAMDVNRQIHVLEEVSSRSFPYPMENYPLVDSNLCKEIPLGPAVLGSSFVASNIPSGSPEIEWQSNNKQSSAVKTNTMSDLFNNIPGMNLAFGKIQKGLIALSLNGELAFKDKSGNYVTINKEGEQKIRTDVGNMKLEIDFYQVPTQELVKDDVILLDGEFLIVGENVKGDTKFINPLTGATTNKLERTNVLNMYFYTKVVSMFDMVGGGSKGGTLGGIDPMMLALMSQGNGAGGQDISQLLLMSQLGGAKGDTNSLLPLLMMSGGLGGASNGENGGIGQLLMLQALSGNKSGGLFGGIQKRAAAKVAPKKAPVKKAAIKKAAVRG